MNYWMVSLSDGSTHKFPNAVVEVITWGALQIDTEGGARTIFAPGVWVEAGHRS